MGLSIRKITAIAGKCMPEDVKSTTVKLTGAMKSGYSIGRRCNSIHDKGYCKSAGTSAVSVKRELSKLKFSRDEMPALAAAITYLIPVPSPIPITPIVYGAGRLVNKFLKIINK